MAFVATLSFQGARTCVIDRVMTARSMPATEHIGLDCTAGRVLAQDAHADRDYPALARSVFNRFPYLEPLNHLQVELLRRYRSGDTEELVQRGILLTMSGLATALRNSG